MLVLEKLLKLFASAPQHASGFAPTLIKIRVPSEHHLHTSLTLCVAAPLPTPALRTLPAPTLSPCTPCTSLFPTTSTAPFGLLHVGPSLLTSCTWNSFTPVPFQTPTAPG